MNITSYKHTFTFYFFSVLIPLILWFSVAYLSHKMPGEYLTTVSFLGFLGLFAPFIIVLILILPNNTLKQDFLSRLVNFRDIKITYILLSLLLMPASILLAQLISVLFGYSLDQFVLRESFTFTSGVFPVSFLLIIAPILEELAWHSYGTDSLRNRYSLLTTSLIFAFFWGIWHVPLSFIKDYYQSNLVVDGLIYSLNFFVSLFPFVIIMNWLYYKSHRSILVAIVFHITAGYFNEIFSTHPMSKVIQTGLLIVLCIYLIKRQPSFFLSK